MKTSLPETIKFNDELEIQIAPHGDHPGVMTLDDGQERDVIQRCGPDDLQRIADAFTGSEILVDCDHTSDHGGSTEAQAWITAMRHDPERGLMATLKWTDIGAAAVSNRRYRFVSPVFAVAETDTDIVLPTALLTLSLTNKPNLPVGCVLNSSQPPTTVQTPVEDRNVNMDKIKELLALAPEADEEAVLAALNTLLTENAELKTAAAASETAALNAEAEKVADDEEDKIENREAFIRLYVENREYARTMLGVLKAPAAPARVTNSREARKPVRATKGSDVLATYNSLKGKERRAYLRENAAEIHAARMAAQ